jgi:hypothetical protein
MKILFMFMAAGCGVVAWWCGQVFFETGRGMFAVSGGIMLACSIVAAKIVPPGESQAQPVKVDEVPSMEAVKVPVRMFYYLDENKQAVGPVTADAMRDLWRRGVVNDETATAFEGDADWVPLSIFADVIFPARNSRGVTGAPGGVPSAKGDSSLESTRTFGRVLVMIAAGLGIYFGLMFDTTVSVGYGKGVHNVGLMNDRMIGFALAGVCFMSGLFLATRRNQ